MPCVCRVSWLWSTTANTRDLLPCLGASASCGQTKTTIACLGSLAARVLSGCAVRPQTHLGQWHGQDFDTHCTHDVHPQRLEPNWTACIYYGRTSSVLSRGYVLNSVGYSTRCVDARSPSILCLFYRYRHERSVSDVKPLKGARARC